MRHPLTTTALALCAFSLSQTALAQTPPCDPAAYTDLQEVLTMLSEPEDPALQFIGPDGEAQPPRPREESIAELFEFAALALAETCRFPDPVLSVLDDVGTVAPDQRMLMVMRGFMADPSLLVAACGAETPRLLAEAGPLAPPDREARFVDGCANLAALAPREALVTRSLDRLLTAAVVYGLLQRQGEPHAQEAGRFLLGLGLTTWSSAP